MSGTSSKGKAASGQRPVASEERSGGSAQDTAVTSYKSEIRNQTSLAPLPSSLSPNPSPFLLLIDPPASGPWNMAVDEALLETAAAEGQCTLRFYQWSEPTLSLGYFQTYADRWQHKASSRSAVVRRSSGGGAIMHDLELTYSFAVPDRHPLAIDRLGFYQTVHKTLIATLAQWGIDAFMFAQPELHRWPGSCENVSLAAPASRKGADGEGQFHPSPASGRGAGGEGSPHSYPAQMPPSGKNIPTKYHHQPFLCFQRRAPGDVLIGETKITGSAQRRCRGAVLQHGSVLLARSVAAPELDGIKELTGQQLSPEQLVDAWLKRLAEVLPGGWQTGVLSDATRRRAETIVVEKHGNPLWIEHRGRV